VSIHLAAESVRTVASNQRATILSFVYAPAAARQTAKPPAHRWRYAGTAPAPLVIERSFRRRRANRAAARTDHAGRRASGAAQAAASAMHRAARAARIAPLPPAPIAGELPARQHDIAGVGEDAAPALHAGRRRRSYRRRRAAFRRAVPIVRSAIMTGLGESMKKHTSPDYAPLMFKFAARWSKTGWRPCHIASGPTQRDRARRGNQAVRPPARDELIAQRTAPEVCCRS